LPGVINGQPDVNRGALDPSSIQSNLSNARSELAFNNTSLADAQRELRTFTANPQGSTIDPANYGYWQTQLEANVATYSTRVNAYQKSIEFNQYLLDSTPSITSQVNAQAAATDPATDPALATNPSGELTTPRTEANADGSTTVTNADGSTVTTDRFGTVFRTEAPTSTTTTDDPTSGPVSPTGTAYDDDGNLNPGWSLDEDNNPVWVGGEFVELATKASADQTRQDQSNAETSRLGRSGVSRGAHPVDPVPSIAQWAEAKDLRVKLRVPPDYLVGPSAGPANIIQKNGGILFPYTPTISLDNQASYATQNPLHSNFPLYFYKNSSVGPIQVTGKFTVQNEFEGAVLLGTIHLLRSLIKMKFGDDPDAGSPPPVCRFDAYGDYMLNNVPVSIASWRHELPDGVDYIAVGRPGSPMIYGHSMVPVLSTISLTLNVMYSRREMLAHNVGAWNSGNLRGRGYI
jgi:hypothetical protein